MATSNICESVRVTAMTHCIFGLHYRLDVLICTISLISALCEVL